ncbi:signal peptidase I [Sodalis endosymbiont of Henestaris halophilus]|uniref:signal peptidase I n=1 Tax=Sodalis endosymbiont of Henestaris halophilus TaxID=1929246 RepID=UPI000BBF9584|nr:signal peptidase I [Sodalis endosymbiont of Henestaris halophilus]SNC58943.1 Signal peptidase I [Sodalis endosymbiont of Henestaris halophilus]
MANVFTLILAIATFITGIFWLVECFKLVLLRYCLRQKRCQQQHADAITVRTRVNYIAIDVSSHMPTFIKSIASFFPILLLVFVVRSFIFEPFQIPSGSMIPTLLVGDFILVKKFSYGIKDPITQTTLIEIGHPKRGDIVVFKYPLDPSLYYIKRVVGLPGDRVSYDLVNKCVMVQPSCAKGQEYCTMALPITYSNFGPSDFVQIFNSTSTADASSVFLQLPPNTHVDNGVRLMQRKESLDGVVHHVLTLPGQKDQFSIYYQQLSSSLAEWVVPQEAYFMMGDNRDNSADSRYWGFVSERNLVGKATAIWMSVDKQEKRWFPNVRFSRIGGIH